MKKLIKNKLERITVNDLEDFKHRAFMVYSSFVKKHERPFLGVNSYGDYVVKVWVEKDDDYVEAEEFRFSTAAAAIERYTEIILED